MHDWDLMEMEVLKEIGMIAAGYGSDALMKLLNREIKVHLPSILSLEDQSFLKEHSGAANSVVSVHCEILAGLNGKLVLAFDERSAVRFMELCYSGYPLSEGGRLNEMGISALKEVGNIVLSAYVTALSVFLKSVVVPSPPTLAMGSFGDIIKNAMADGRVYVLLIEAIFEKAEEKIKGEIGFLLTADDHLKIQKSCQQSIEQHNMGDDRGTAFNEKENPLSE